MKKRIITFIVLTGAHFCALVFFFFLTFSLGMRYFDEPEGGNKLIEFIAGAGLYILGIPLVTPMLTFSITVPDLAEWMMLGFNSIIWGLVGTFIIFKIIKLKKPNQRLEPTRYDARI